MTIEDLYGVGEIELSRMLWHPEVIANKDIVAQILSFDPLIYTSSEHYDINRRYGRRRKRTLLHYAIEINDLEFLKMLLDHGLDATAVDEYLSDILSYATKPNREHILQYLLDHEIGESPNCPWHALHYAGGSGHWDAVKILLDYGTSINVLDRSGNTVLHHVCAYVAIGRSTTAIDYSNILLRLGVDKTIKNVNGQTAYDNVKNYQSRLGGDIGNYDRQTGRPLQEYIGILLAILEDNGDN